MPRCNQAQAVHPPVVKTLTTACLEASQEARKLQAMTVEACSLQSDLARLEGFISDNFQDLVFAVGARPITPGSGREFHVARLRFRLRSQLDELHVRHEFLANKWQEITTQRRKLLGYLSVLQ